MDYRLEIDKYDYELYRTNAFIINNNKIFKGDTHFDCLLYWKEHETGIHHGELYDLYNCKNEYEILDSENCFLGEFAKVEGQIKEVVVTYEKEVPTNVVNLMKGFDFYYLDNCILKKIEV